MKILDRYIGRTVTGSILTALVILLTVFTLFELVDEFDNMGHGQYGVKHILLFTVLRVPSIAYKLFPIAALIGSLFGLSLLTRHNEIAVVRTSGVSLERVVWAVLKGGLIVVIMAVLLGEFVVPPSEQYARFSKSFAMSEQVSLKTKNGLWVRDGQKYINISKILPGDKIKGVYIYEFDGANRLRTTTFAKSGEYKRGRWILRDIHQTSITQHRVVTQQIDKAAWESLLRPSLINLVIIEPNNLSIRDLLHYISYLSQNDQSILEYEQALWVKIVYPIATAVMVFLAIPIVLGSVYTSTLGQRVLIGIFIGLSFHIANQAAGHLSVVYHLNPALCIVTPTLVTLLAGVMLMRRVA